ncbi:MAG: hypothetical protein BWY04_00112 [candidate division CPR1 bacterium ADurb.Bin160]|uniref:Uncharacterized protein n=1 Tax=candidate division CPR1 bacterium ADurb.Bin160 TaxID=1852826 RepID=A0A1V5ZS66_9BACT|nr:MAG: hypothetical protein BWY04_00112 [candidate division CPR1 bacterium ADurb.Bin160]
MFCHNHLNKYVTKLKDSGNPHMFSFCPFIIDSYILFLHITSSDFTVNISCKVYTAEYASNARTSISPNLCHHCLDFHHRGC